MNNTSNGAEYDADKLLSYLAAVQITLASEFGITKTLELCKKINAEWDRLIAEKESADEN